MEKFISVCAMFTGRDPKSVLSIHSGGQQFQVCVEAVCFWALLVWVFVQLGHVLDSILIAFIAAILIGGLDYAVGKTLHRGWNKLVALRIVIAAIVSSTLALGFLLERNKGALDNEAKFMRAEQMAPLLASFNTQLAQDRTDIVGNKTARFNQASTLLAAAEEKLASAQKARNAAATAQRAYLIESGDEKEGFGERLTGCGEKCLAARRRADAEGERIATLDADIQAFRLEAQIARNGVTESSKALEAANREYEAKEKARQAELVRDPRYLPEVAGDFVSRFSALTSLSGKPGGSSLYITFVSQLVLFILLDLAYLAMRQSTSSDDVHPDLVAAAVIRERQSKDALQQIKDLATSEAPVPPPPTEPEAARPRSTVVSIDTHRRPDQR
jgi:hypothetical protein